MSTIAQLLASLSDQARRYKQDAVEEVQAAAEAAAASGTAIHVEDSETDLHPTLLALRGGLVVAQIFPDMSEPPSLPELALVAAGGFAADQLGLIIDTLVSTSPLSPLTGQPWGPGELERIVELHDGRAKGWVSDALLVAVYNRAGDYGYRGMCYRVDEEQFTLTWSEEVSEDSQLWRGPSHNALLRVMTTEQTIQQSLAADGLSGEMFGLDPEQMLAYSDCVTAKMFLTGQGGCPRAVVALAADAGTAREAIIVASMPTGKVVR